MDQETEPEIKRINMCATVLFLKNIKFNNILSFSFLDRPSDYQLVRALTKLRLIGALTCDGDLTSIGKKIIKFPLEPIWGKFLLTCQKYGCISEGLTITAMTSVENIYTNSNEDEEENLEHSYFSKYGDLLTSLNIWEEFSDSSNFIEFCSRKKLNPRIMKQVKLIREQLQDVVKHELPIVKIANNKVDAVRKSIARTFYFNSVQKRFKQNEQDARYRAIDSKIKENLFIHNRSCMYKTEHQWLVFTRITYTNRPFIHGITSVNFDWIKDLLPLINRIDINRLTKGSLNRLQKDLYLRKKKKKIEMYRILVENTQENNVYKKYPCKNKERSKKNMSKLAKSVTNQVSLKDVNSARERYLVRMKILQESK